MQKTIKNWGLFTHLIKEFFLKNDFTEILTPYLVQSPGLEPHLEPFETRFDFGQLTKNLYLPTSPEFHLKKALCRGHKKIFELKTCFRNGEISQHHQPEFLMLEWYRAAALPEVIISDINKLLLFLSKKFKKRQPKIKIYKMAELWKKHLNFNLTPSTTKEELLELAEACKIDFQQNDDFDDLFMRLWIEKIEPMQNAQDKAWIVRYYPPSQAALAKLTKDGWADRFEFYFNGLEIANAFNELTDYKEQRVRFVKDQQRKQILGKKVIPIDEDFMTYLEKGMPNSSGVALGVDRLFMALFNIKDINKMRLFPFKL
ncbi:MAG: EF-P lysine aminoacylase GenX [Oligoflexia bacterium]|nr:EF-P lysine aminoacylase GenX [Oligoflexia bacterium]